MNITKIEIYEMLKEDKAFQDITTEATVVQNKMQRFAIISKNEKPFVLCGIEALQKAFDASNAQYKIDITKEDGNIIQAREIIVGGHASIKELLQIERTVLNLIQHLSGVATKTQTFVLKLNSPSIKILDTRKTIPHIRKLQKYAVLTGGGQNHRMDLAEMILIKDNHIANCNGEISEAIRLAKKRFPRKKIEVECETIQQVIDAVKLNVDIIMLDNMSISQITEASKIIRTNPKIKIEVSGGITLANISNYSHLDIDFISTGSITHSIESVDISMEVFA
jgi:nicotinate-nucleotide pyrophosphorylase (carboxylating)